MPKSGRITSYPIEYFDLFKRAIAGETLKFELQSRKAASNLRFDLYAFRAALRADVDVADSALELAITADSLEFLIEDKILTVQSRDKAESVQIIKRVLSGE